jgi:hypothetical protein
MGARVNVDLLVFLRSASTAAQHGQQQHQTEEVA